MPRGPKGEKRPRDPASAAVQVMRIATGQEEEDVPRRRIRVKMELREELKRPKDG